MAKFFVGCRVRIIDGGNVPADCRELIGLEGVIDGHGADGFDWSVNLEGSCWDADVDENNLARILDPGATPSVFSLSELMDGLRSGELVAP